MKHVKFGQNFLTDRNIAEKIVYCAELAPKDTVIEIGSGRGILTELIAPQVKKLICIEIDPELVKNLQEKFKNQKNIRIIHADFLEWNFPNSKLSTLNSKLISNLPYYVTSPILRKVLSFKNWSTAVFMMQKEVGERVLAGPGTKTNGVLTLIVNYFAIPEKLFNVSRNSFKPEPEVDSIVLKFTKKKLSASQYALSDRFLKVVKAAFCQRRKTVINSLSSGTRLPKDLLMDKLAKNGIEPATRPECIPIDKFISLAIDLKGII